MWGVHIQKLRACASDRRLANDARAGQEEVLVPAVLARMKDRRNLIGIGINAGQIGPFVKVTFRAGQGEVFGITRAAVLPCRDMLNMESQAGTFLRQPTILTSVLGTTSDEITCSRVHQAALA